MSAQTTLTELPKGLFHLVLEGHVLDALAMLPSDSVDCVMTSPPYWGLRDYKIEPTVWDGAEGCEHKWLNFQRGGQSGLRKQESSSRLLR